MRKVFCAASEGFRAPTQMIWLPGAYHSAQDFVNEGFVRAAAQRRAPIDLQFVDLEMQHLDDRDAFQRLQSEIVLPAHDSGAAVWLAGISLGGLVALDYASIHLGELDGLCLLAPYLGNRMLINEIAAASGLAGWEPGELAESDAERRIWRYIKTRTDARPLFLGYGRDDRFSAAQDLLAAALPSAWVNTVAGGHEWGTWLRLWESFLDSQFL
jgi:alpha-beta hydrolase superfamily lysophospholipase